jgi:hypothetical protein
MPGRVCVRRRSQSHRRESRPPVGIGRVQARERVVSLHAGLASGGPHTAAAAQVVTGRGRVGCAGQGMLHRPLRSCTRSARRVHIRPPRLDKPRSTWLDGCARLCVCVCVRVSSEGAGGGCHQKQTTKHACVHWVAVPKGLRARRVNRRRTSMAALCWCRTPECVAAPPCA